MYTNSTLKPIQDDELYIGLDGTQWANTDKGTIPELHKVIETERPDEANYIVTGFHINDKYEQVWDYEPRPAPEPAPELTYAQKRAIEYPPYTDYLDGIVKGDESQVQEYINKCLAIKAKYPKP